MVKAMRPKGLAPYKGAGTSRTFRPWKAREDVLLFGAASAAATNSASRVQPTPPSHPPLPRGRRVVGVAAEERGRGDQKRRIASPATGSTLTPSFAHAFASTVASINPSFTLAHSQAPCAVHDEFPLLNPLIANDSFASSNSCPPKRRNGRAKVAQSPSTCVHGRHPVASDVASRRSARSSGARGGAGREASDVRGGGAKCGQLKKRICSGYGSQLLDTSTASAVRDRDKANKEQINFRDPKATRSHMKSIVCKDCNKGSANAFKKKRTQMLHNGGNIISDVPKDIQDNVTTKHIPIEEHTFEGTEDLIDVPGHESEKNNKILPRKINDEFEWEEIRKDKCSTSWETLDEEELVSPKDESKVKNVLKSADTKLPISCKGWEEVVFSVHVHVPQNSDPNATVLPIAQVHPSPKHSFSRKRRKFETASEILVLPILARKHFNNDINILNSSKPLNSFNQVIDNFTTNKRTNVSCQLLSKVDSNTRILSADTLSFTTDNSPNCNNITCATGSNDISFSKKIRDTISGSNNETMSSSEHQYKIVQTENENTNLRSSNLSVDGSTLDNSCDLRLHQQEFVKIVHEMELITKRDVSTSTHSMVSKGMVVEAIHKVKSFSDISRNSSLASTSFCITKSYVCQDKLSTTDETDLRMFIGEDNNESLSPDSKCYSSDADDEPFENRLPILLHQNEKVRNILEKVVSKLEEANERVGIKIMEKFKSQGRGQEDLLTNNECGKVTNVIVSGEAESNGSNVKLVSSDFEVNKSEAYLKYWCKCGGSNTNMYEVMADDEISEEDTKQSARHDSGSEAEEGDDEADDAMSWNDGTTGRGGEQDAEDGQTEGERPPGDGPLREACHCLDARDECTRHPSHLPARTGDGGRSSLCECPRFNDTCPWVEGMRPSDDYSSTSSNTMQSSVVHSSLPLSSATSAIAGSAAPSASASPVTSPAPSYTASANGTDVVSSVRSPGPSATEMGRSDAVNSTAATLSISASNSRELPSSIATTLPTHLDPELSSKHSVDDDWIPWTREEDTGDVIPPFSPSKENTVSIITLPPKYAPKAMDIFQGTNDEALSVSADKAPIWVPDTLMPDSVPETISEFHWMPDKVRGFSSTIITPEVSDNVKVLNGGTRPAALSHDNSSSADTTDSSFFRSNEIKPEGTFSKITSPNAPPIIGTELIQVITSAVERGLAPLRTSIDEIRAKIEKLEACGNNALKPDILVGVSAVSQCVEQKCAIHPQSKTDYKCFSGGGVGNSQELNVSTCVNSIPPYSVVMVRQHEETNQNLGIECSVKGTSHHSEAFTCGKSNYRQTTPDFPKQTIGLQTDDNGKRSLLPPCPDEKCKKPLRKHDNAILQLNKNNLSPAIDISGNVEPLCVSAEDEKVSSETAPVPPQFRDEGLPGGVPDSFVDNVKEKFKETPEVEGRIEKSNFPVGNFGLVYGAPKERRLQDKNLLDHPEVAGDSSTKAGITPSSLGPDISRAHATPEQPLQTLKRPERCQTRSVVFGGSAGSSGGERTGACSAKDPAGGFAGRGRPPLPLPSQVRFPLCKCSPSAASYKALSPLAQMYIDLSKAKHDWAGVEPVGVVPTGPEEAAAAAVVLGGREGRGPLAARVGVARARDDAHSQRVTLAFSGDVSPLIDISLTPQGKVVVGGKGLDVTAGAAAKPSMRPGGSSMSFTERRALTFHR